MCGAGQLHRDNSQGGGEGRGEPAERLEPRLVGHQAKKLGYRDPDESAEEVAEDESAWLGEGTLNCAEAEHSRGALVYTFLVQVFCCKMRLDLHMRRRYREHGAM